MVRTKRKANYSTRPSKRYKKGYTRRRYRYGVRGRGRLSKLVKKTIVRMAEPKDVMVAPAIYELYHNGGSPASGRLGNFLTLNQTAYMPNQGDGDGQRNGDRIYLQGISVHLMLGQKWDRPNVTFKIIVARLPKGTINSMNKFFRNISSNILLDSVNTDYVKRILYYKTLKPHPGGMIAAGTYQIPLVPPFQPIPGAEAVTREYSFPHKFWIPVKKEYKFADNNGIEHQDDDIVMFFGAYDAQGTLETDNIANCRVWVKLSYRDP